MTKFLPLPKSSQRGQAVLIILLVVSVVLVVGLSVASRSVTDIKISQQSQEAARALWIAQAALEKAIKANAGVPQTTNESLNIEYSTVKRDLTGTEFVFPEEIGDDESVVVWLIDHNADGTLKPASRYTGNSLTLYWGKCNSGITPALEATLVYKSGAKFLQKRYALDPDPGRATLNNFSSAVNLNCAVLATANFSFNSAIALPGGVVPYFLRLRLIYNSQPQPVGVVAQNGKNFPGQGNCFVSTAQVMESGVTRKLEQCQLWTSVPSTFDFLLYSGKKIKK